MIFDNKYKKRIESKIIELTHSISSIEKEYQGVKTTIEPEKYCHYWVLKKHFEDDIKLLKSLL